MGRRSMHEACDHHSSVREVEGQGARDWEKALLTLDMADWLVIHWIIGARMIIALLAMRSKILVRVED